MLPSAVRSWVEARFPEWTVLPDRLVLKRQKKGWAREFNTEKVAYERLRPLQGVVIPRYFGEVRFRNRRTMVMSDIGGESLAAPQGMLVQLDEFRRLLFQALNSFAPFGITHGDNKLDNYHVTGDKIMIVDLEKIDDDSADEHERPAVNEAIVDFLSGHYQRLQNRFWEEGLIGPEEG
jgi:RIO-like serine/threonine protein kinase